MKKQLFAICLFTTAFFSAQVDSIQTAEIETDYFPTAERVVKRKGWINNRNSVLVRGVEALLKGIHTDKKKIYFLLEINNRSSIPYDIESVSFISVPMKKKNAEIEEEEKVYMPIWSSDVESIPQKSTKKIVYVFDKFTISPKKNLKIVVNEVEGERVLNIETKSSNIVNAEFIK